MAYKEPEYKDPRAVNQPLFPDTGIQLHCPNCTHNIFSEDINLDKSLAKCSECHTVFSFEETVNSSVRNRPEVFLPEEIEILSLESELNIHYKWRKTKAIHPFLVFFTVLWNAMILPVAFIALAGGELQVLLFLSLHLLVGFGLLGFIISRLINSTYITVDDYELGIEHRPISIPYIFQDYHINSQDIEQLYSQKYVASESNGHKNYAFAVVAQLKGGKEIKILKGLKRKDKALFIEQEIELFLGIKDQPVEGEVP